MKKGILKSILFSLAGLAIFATSVIYLNRDNNAIKLKADEEINITISDIHDYLSMKEEHYPISDLFINEYQQTGGGYIAYAKQLGMNVDKSLALPNQKWHFFNSWLYRSIDDGSLSWNDSAKSRVYSKLLCPELVLWIYEACNVDAAKVQAAYDVAVQGKIDGVSTTTIAKNMRSQVSWEDMKEDIENYISHSTAPHYVSCTSGAGYAVSAFDENGYTRNTKVTFTVTVTDDTKQINIVDSSSASILNPSEGVYEFYMPNRDVDIEISLKDKDPSDLLFAAVDLDFPTEDQTGSSRYNNSFTCSNRNYPFEITNASNNSNKWDCFKIGRSGENAISTVINTSPIVESIEGIKIDFGSYDSKGVDSVLLKIADDSGFANPDIVNLSPYLTDNPGEVYFPINENYRGNNKYYNIEFQTNHIPGINGFVAINRIIFLTSNLDKAQSIAVTGNLPSFSVGTEFEFNNVITAHYSISGDRTVTTNLIFNINYEPIAIGDFIPYSSAGSNIPFEIVYTPDADTQVSVSYKIDIATATINSFVWNNSSDISVYYGKTISDVSSKWTFDATWSTTYVEHPTIGETIDDVHVALYDTSSPTEEINPLPMNYKFTKADNDKYLVAFYHGVKASNIVRVSTYRSVYEEVSNGTIIYDFSEITTNSQKALSVEAFNAYYVNTSTLPIGENTVDWAYRSDVGQIKLGNSTQQGRKLVFVLEERLIISSVTVRAKKYASTSTTLDIMGNTVTLEEDYVDYTFTLSNEHFGETNVFTLNVPNKKTAGIRSISIVCGGYKNIGKSSDCVAVETFITNYMHMEDYTENLGWCKDQEHHYYDSARTAFNNLTLEQRTLFMTNEAYADEKDRLSAWAEANTSGFDNENKVLLARNELVKEDRSYYIVLIGLILAVGGTITTFVLVNKSKRNEKGL